MNIREIAEKINKLYKKYRFGELQDLRKKRKGLDRKGSSTIFTDKTISDQGWAFHHGGRKEIQFNIGIEKEGLRYGLAFSLKKSHSLPSLDALYPKILNFNFLIRNEPALFIDYKMWHWQGTRGNITDVHEINGELAQEGTFVFIGKLIDIENIDFHEILSTFDDLLNIYEEVETEPNKSTKTQQKESKFKFDNKSKKLPKKSSYNSIEKEINIDVRHTYLQEKLYNHLVSVHGKSVVSLENPINGNRIDIVVKTAKNSYIFYEIKTGSSAKSCIRQAMGQLFEYAFWNNPEFKATMIVAGEFEIDETTSEYIRFLENNFNIPISYY